MSILSRYVGLAYLLIFGVALTVFAFVMGLGSVIRVIDLVARGVSAPALLKYFLLSFPFILQYAIPMSVMTATILLVTRLSLDGEIAAMKACGMSLWQVVSPIIAASVMISFASMYISNWMSPRSRAAQRDIVTAFSSADPLLLIEQGRWIRDFPGLMVYIGGKSGTNLSEIVIYQHDEDSMRSSIRARSGTVRTSPDGAELLVDLFDVRMEKADRKDPLNPAKSQTMIAEFYPQRFDVSKLRKQQSVRKKKAGDMPMDELFDVIRHADRIYASLLPSEIRTERMKALVEANSRMAMSLSCIAMTLIGIPLGLRSRRRESSIGVLVSLLVIFFFYFFVMIAKSMSTKPDLYPDLLVWIPVLAAEIGGLWMIHKAN